MFHAVPEISFRVKFLLRSLFRMGNWLEVALNFALGKNPRRIVLNGIGTICGEQDYTLSHSVYGTFFRRIYTGYGLQLEAGDIVVDIGANVGTFSILSANGGVAKVLAYEPHPGNFRHLTQNLRVCGASCVQAFPLAVAAKAGAGNLSLSPISGGHSLFDPEMGQCLKVMATTLPELMVENRIDRIDFLKLDCEGAEGAILQATPREQLRRIKKIAMEFHNGYSSLDHRAMQKLLNEAGFKTEVRWDGRSVTGYLYARLIDAPTK